METISVQFCPMYYKGKAGQSSDSSALLPRKIGVLPDLLDVYSALYLPVCSAALCSPVGSLSAATVQPCVQCALSQVAFFSDPELIRSSNSPKKWTKWRGHSFFLFCLLSIWRHTQNSILCLCRFCTLLVQIISEIAFHFLPIILIEVISDNCDRMEV